MKLRMLTTMKGSPDGIQVNEYLAGRKYDLPRDLANNFLGQNVAEEDKELVLETKGGQQEKSPGLKRKRR